MENMKEKSPLEDLKKDYAILEKKYNLPSFKDLNEAFDIEKASESETDCLMREIRKAVMDKTIAYLRFVEMMINPSNAPIFFMILLKNLTDSEKRVLERIYEKLGEFEIEVVALDCRYDERREAEFIKELYEAWREVEEDIVSLVEVLKKNWGQKSGQGNIGYYG